MFQRKSWIVAISCLLSLGLLVGLSRAQEKKEGAGKSDEKVKKASIPDYFGDIGLSEKQKDDVRKATQPMDEKIASLKKQIADLQKQVVEQEGLKLAAAEKLLTDVQKASLKERRATADAEKSAKKTKKTANGDEKKPDEKK